MSWRWRDGLILTLVPLIATAFSLFEWGGVTDAPWNSISYYAINNTWLAFGIGAAVVDAAIVFEAWWVHHMHTRIRR